MSESREQHDDEPATLHEGEPSCLCCSHFVIDLEAEGSHPLSRRSRTVKHKHTAFLLAAS
ncbi:MAG: hypothetical protein KatS3mg102_2228 [Planctomycetota bacterium]|nr:MAG: hypothetical protein KatS3mg102_2228 [Planctomycetota bacterium]